MPSHPPFPLWSFPVSYKTNSADTQTGRDVVKETLGTAHEIQIMMAKPHQELILQAIVNILENRNFFTQIGFYILKSIFFI
jgi:hypothetical protein